MPSLYGTDVTVNPRLRNEARSFNGKTVNELTILVKDDTNTAVEPDRMGPDSALRRILDIVTERATVIMVSEVGTSGNGGTVGQFRVFVEGDFPGSDFDGQDFATYTQSQIQAATILGKEDLNVSNTTVTAGTTFYADDVVMDYPA